MKRETSIIPLAVYESKKSICSLSVFSTTERQSQQKRQSAIYIKYINYNYILFIVYCHVISPEQNADSFVCIWLSYNVHVTSFMRVFFFVSLIYYTRSLHIMVDSR